MIELVSDFKNRFEQALKYRDIKPVEISEKTGISESTISQYRSGYAKPKEDKLVILSNALDVNPVWLLGVNVPMLMSDIASSSHLRSDEARLLKYYNKLNEDGRKVLIGSAEGLSNNSKYKKDIESSEETTG